MKTKHRMIIKLTSLALLLVMTAVFTQCVPKNAGQVGSSSSQKPPVSDPGCKDCVTEETIVAEGVKNFEQLRHTFAALTGIAPNNAAIMTVFGQISTSLPTTNDIKVFQTANQLAVTKLAYAFCSNMIDNAALRPNLWPNSFALHLALPAVAFTASNRIILIDDLIESAWGGVISDQEKALAEEEFDQLIDDLLVGEMATAISTRNVLKGLCTAALSSAHVTLL